MKKFVVWVVLLFLVYTTAVASPTKASTCKTCKALNYECLPASPPTLNNCGRVLDPTSCLIPSCQTWCHDNLQIQEGYCDSTERVCKCGQAPILIAVTEEPAAVTISPPQVAAPIVTIDCPPTDCDFLADSFTTCIPSTYVDSCTHHSLPVGTCASRLPNCNTQCATKSGSTCANDGKSCKCGRTANATIASTTPVKLVHAAIAPIVDETVYHSNGTIVPGRGGIVGITFSSALGTALTIVFLIHFISQYCMYSKSAEFDSSQLPVGDIPLRARA